MRLQFATILLLLLFWWLALSSAQTNAPIIDEPMHMLRALTLNQTGELHFQIGHAPLSHRLIGILLRTEPTVPDLTTLSGWAERDRHVLADAVLWQASPRFEIQRAYFLGRVSIIWTAMLIGVITAVFAKRRQNEVAALTVLILFAFSPNVLAAATVGTTDLVSVAGFVITVWGLWEFQRRERWFWLGLAGVGIGLAMGAKLTGGLMVPLALALLLFGERFAVSAAESDEPRGRFSWKRPFLHWVAMGPIALFVLWGIFGFEVRPLPGSTFPLPAATYWDNFVRVTDHIDGGHQTFLFGEQSHDGWYHYFLVAFGVKTPLPVLLLLAVGIGGLFWQGRGRRTLFLWLPMLALLGAASISRLNIGYRHILPMLPFVWLIIGEALATSGLAQSWGKRRLNLSMGVTLLLLIWLVVGTLRVHPHHLSYFNELVGVDNGYRVLSDSNVDWGQDFYQLEDYVKTADFPIHVGYRGVLRPALGEDAWEIDIETEAIAGYAPANPAAGSYALSAAYVQGMSLAEPDLFYGFRQREPDGRVGYSILLYDVPSAATGAFVGHCAAPVPLLSPNDAERMLGQQGLRHFNFDCTSGWVFPENGRSGWFVVPQGVVLDWVDEQLSGSLELVFRHRSTVLQPAYDIYYWDGGEVKDELSKVEAGWPILFGETAVLLGDWHDGMTWVTAWEASADAPPELSVQAHLVVAENGPPLVADGLAFSSIQWQAGDIFLQRHQFDQEGIRLKTGIYNFVTGEPIPPTPIDLPR